MSSATIGHCKSPSSHLSKPSRGSAAVRIQIEPDNRLLTPAEVAAMLRVDPKTVTRWARAGKLSSIRTPGGHRRYIESEVLGFLGSWAAGNLPRATGE